VPADAFVLAAGSWTARSRERSGSGIPMEPGKGYSFLLRPKVMPRHGILFADIHAGLTPLGEPGAHRRDDGVLWVRPVDRRTADSNLFRSPAITSISSDPTTRSRGPGSAR